MDSLDHFVARVRASPELLHHDFICQKSKRLEVDPGIYFLIFEKEIVYVGQAVNVYERIGRHVRDTQKRFDRFYVWHCDRDELDTLELHYIKKFQPIYNFRHVTRDIETGERIFQRDKEEPLKPRALFSLKDLKR